MKKCNLSIEQTGFDNRIDLNIQAIVACLTGQAPGMSLSGFASVWQQMLPESNLMPPLSDGPDNAGYRQRQPARPREEGNIREGPD